MEEEKMKCYIAKHCYCIMILSVYRRSNSYLLFLNCIFYCCGEAFRRMCSMVYNIILGPDECGDEMEWAVLK